jgi:hypothetical protein
MDAKEKRENDDDTKIQCETYRVSRVGVSGGLAGADESTKPLATGGGKGSATSSFAERVPLPYRIAQSLHAGVRRKYPINRDSVRKTEGIPALDSHRS